MSKLVKQIPALVATTKEIALPKLNTFWRYAKVGSIVRIVMIIEPLNVQVELAPPSPGDIPVAIADLSTKIANAQKQTFRKWTVSKKN